MAYPQPNWGNYYYAQPQTITVYTDGACQNNGMPNPRAGIGGAFVEYPQLNFSLPCPNRQTSNSAEIYAANHAICVARQAGFVAITLRTDSEFMLNCLNWKANWKANGWRKANGELVENREELQILDQAIQGVNINFSNDKLLNKNFEKFNSIQEYVPSHQGNLYNELADRLARDGCMR